MPATIGLRSFPRADGAGIREAGWPQHPLCITFEGSEGSVFIWRGVVDAQPKALLGVKIAPTARIHLDRFV